MNNELLQKWITALRSGQYQQGKQRLQTEDNKFCCLGVLCDILPEKGKWGMGSDDEPVFRLFDPPLLAELTDEDIDLYTAEQTLDVDLGSAAKDFGLESSEMNLLVGLNDSGATFEEIAALLETPERLTAEALEFGKIPTWNNSNRIAFMEKLLGRTLPEAIDTL